MYTCTICLSLNHNVRLHCQHCGAVPAKYSFNGKVNGRNDVEIVRAHGAFTVGQYKASRINLKTVESDYYADL